jgi:acetate kinase
MSGPLTVLAVNAGSSSLNLALYAMGGEERLLARGEALGHQ